MASQTPLLQVEKSPAKKTPRSKASLFYNADDYIKELEGHFEHDHEIGAIMDAAPDQEQSGAGHQDKMNKLDLNDANRSKKTGRLFPTSNKPNPMPKDLAFLFTKITPEQGMYMWKFLTAIWMLQWVMVITYAVALSQFGESHWRSVTVCFGIPFAYVAIQHIYVDHDVMHGVTFPPFWWQKFLTHPFSDFVSIPWEEFILEHMKHHSSTVDLLTQGEFGWDPEMPLYWLMENKHWYFTVWFIPLIHFLGLNDTGALFCMEWYMHFPEAGAGGKCNKEFWTKWFPRRLQHQGFVCATWVGVYLLGQYSTGHGLLFMFCVSCAARCGYGSAWLFITSFTHSHPWNNFLATDPHRSWPILHTVMAYVLGGRHRWNEMLFHDVHHAFPNAVGTLSQRGRFNKWNVVHDAAAKILERGLFKPNGDADTLMQKQQRKRSLLLKQRIDKK